MDKTYDEKKISSPLRLLLIIIGSTFAAELMIMWIISRMGPGPEWVKALIDSFLLVTLTFPVVYRFSFRPMAKHIEKRNQAETDLQETLDELEIRIQERTKTLKQANRELQLESSERKKAEEALQQSESRLSSILENAAEAVISIDETQKVILFNQEAERVFQYQAEEILGQSLEILIPRMQAKAHRRHVEDFASSEERRFSMMSRDQVAGRRKDGTNFPASVGISHHVENGQKILTAVLIDITEQKKAEEALRVSEERYRSLFNRIPAALYRTTPNGEILDANPALVQMLGYPDRETLMQVNVNDFYIDNDERMVGEVILERKEGVRDKKFQLKTFDDRTIWVQDSTHIVWDEGGKILYYEGNLEDITERVLAEVEIKKQLQRLQALRSIDIAISNSFDLRVVLNVVLDQITEQLGIDAACLLLLNPVSQTLEFAAGRGFQTEMLQHTKLGIGSGYAGRAAAERRVIHIPDLRGRQTDFLRSPYFSQENFVTYLAVPIIVKGQFRGVLEVFNRSRIDPDPDWLDFLETLAGQAAIAVDNAQLFDGLQHANTDLLQAYDATIEGWSHALDLRDKETEGHTQRVTQMTVHLAREMGISNAQIVHIRRGALLHDIGKMGVPDNILLKPGPLTDDEWVIMRRHPRFAYDMLSRIAYLQPALDIPYYHHERWDGTGYPQGLKGEDIPLAARIFAVIDVWDALRSDRPYRPAWLREKALEHIRSLAGTHFDSEVVEVFLNSIDTLDI